MASASARIEGTVYLGSDWLLYADPDLSFDWSECVAPSLLFGSTSRTPTVLQRGGAAVTAPVMLHAAGVWSTMPGRTALALLYVDPLSVDGAALQWRAADEITAWPTLELLARHGLSLASLCAGDVAADELRDAVSALRAEVLAACAAHGAPEIDPRLLALRSWLHERAEGRADPAAIGARLGLSAEHVRKHFRQHVGMTLSSYQAWVRLYRMTADACAGGHEGQSPNVLSVIMAAGFFDASHASRTVRRYLDLQPSEMVLPRAFVDCRGPGTNGGRA